jgi:hypothetical protein
VFLQKKVEFSKVLEQKAWRTDALTGPVPFNYPIEKTQQDFSNWKIPSWTDPY